MVDVNAVLAWFQSGSNLIYAIVLFLGLWIGYEYLIDLALRMPRVFIISTAVYFILKTFLGFPL